MLLLLLVVAVVSMAAPLRRQMKAKEVAPAPQAAQEKHRRIIARNLSFSAPNGERVNFAVAMRTAQLTQCIKTCGSPSTSRPTYTGCVARCNKMYNNDSHNKK